MSADMNVLDCGRENDLMAFLYGELDPKERQLFDRHIGDCPACQTQLQSFTNIRESVIAWRNETLSALWTPVEDATPAVHQPRPSALAALREFFNLSPLWMKGAVAFASVLFCVLAVLAAVRLTETSPQVVREANNVQAQQEFNAQVERRVQEELNRRQNLEATTTTVPNPSDQSPIRVSGNRKTQLASTNTKRKAGRPLSKLERQELAADLRLVAEDGDGGLELIGDRINQ